MMTVELKKVSFKKEEGCAFNAEMRKRVNLYFRQQELSPKASGAMIRKSLFLMSLVILTYAGLISNLVTGWGFIGLYILFGFLAATATMNISHDALHSAYLKNQRSNRILGLLMDLFGTSSFYWKKEHTQDHHTYTNVSGHDADLDVPFLLRLCPDAKRRSFHRFQQWYAPLLYSLNLTRWVYYSDLKRIFNIFKNREISAKKISLAETLLLLLFKCLHVLIFLLIPIWYLSTPWWMVMLGYVCFLSTAGLTLTLIFQLAHIVENVAFPLPNEEGKMQNSFAKHQLMTTSDFATRNKLVKFLFGGLNFQIEHHIFPQICHIHLKNIAPIVKATALEFGVPYYENPTFFKALCSHFKTLKKFGRS